MPLWKEDSDYIKLKEQTRHEATWRRLVATTLMFIIVMTAFSIGAIGGEFLVAKLSGDISNFSEIWSLRIGFQHIVGAIVIALPMAVYSIHVWRWLMIKTNFVSDEMIERISSYGPY